MQLSSASMQLQVWYGVLFSVPGTQSAERPVLPDWAQDMLDDGAGGEDMHAALTARGYAGIRLAWIRYAAANAAEAAGYGLAVAESVQSARCCAGEISTCFPEPMADAWIDRIARALQVLGPGSARITWYQTAAP